MPATTRNQAKNSVTDKVSKLDRLPPEILHQIICYLLPEQCLANYEDFAKEQKVTFTTVLERIRLLLSASNSLASNTMYVLGRILQKGIDEVDHSERQQYGCRIKYLRQYRQRTEATTGYLEDDKYYRRWLKVRLSRNSTRDFGRVYEIGCVFLYAHDYARAIAFIDMLLSHESNTCIKRRVGRGDYFHHDFEVHHWYRKCFPYTESLGMWKKIREAVGRPQNLSHLHPYPKRNRNTTKSTT